MKFPISEARTKKGQIRSRLPRKVAEEYLVVLANGGSHGVRLIGLLREKR
jgi:hypothetical protein